MTRLTAPFDPARLDDEWLEADGSGGFASGTAGTARTRRYHALLLAATRPPSGRIVLVNGVEAWLETQGERFPLTTQRYAPDLLYPDIAANLAGFDTEPWPAWQFRHGAGTLSAEVWVAKASRETVLRWRLDTASPVTLKVRPLLSGRDYHALHHENPAFDFSARIEPETGEVSWQPYADLPRVTVASNGVYTHAPDWYRNFCYVRERERGLDFTEDLATPGVFSFDLSQGEAVMIFSAGALPGVDLLPQAGADRTRTLSDAAARARDRAGAVRRDPSPVRHAGNLAEAERARRAGFGSRLERSADAYVASRNLGHTVLAGFPWFTDWGRDTFIAMRGLLIATGRHADAESILLEWADTLSEGMLPNRFPDYGSAPEYNAVDASLWFIVAVHEYLASGHAPAATTTRLQHAADAILDGYTRGTRYGIAADSDGLLRAGAPGVQLTWMDAKVGDWVVTQRSGKPVEVQALWINALGLAARWNPRWAAMEARARASFAARFTNPASGGLYDVVDTGHVAGTFDRSIRPNQIFAVGGLPLALLDGEAARAVVAEVEAHLLTPLGLRTLAPSDPAYRPRYGGPPLERDGAYHQGTVWPWLLGPFVEAWLCVNGNTAARRDEARARFLAPLLAHLDTAGLDHLSEVADGDAPHTPGGAPFQAWSLGELLRIARLLDAGV